MSFFCKDETKFQRDVCKKKLCSYVILSKIKIKNNENHLKHISLHLRRTCLSRYVPTRTTHNSIPPTRLVAIPESQLWLARLVAKPPHFWPIHPKLSYPSCHPSPRKNSFHIYFMGDNPTFCIYCQPNLAKNSTNFYRNLCNNSPHFIQNTPKIT